MYVRCYEISTVHSSEKIGESIPESFSCECYNIEHFVKNNRMLEIAFCDDQKSNVQEVYQHVKKNLARQNIDVNYTAFLSGKKLLASGKNFDIVFLDIEMPEMDGIEVGTKLRQKNEKCKIIMVTSMKERFKDAFRFQAFRFVTKPINEDEIAEAISSAIRVPLGQEEIELYLNRILYKVPQRDIQYIRAFNGYTEFITGENVYRREESLVTILEELNPKLFFKISRQYIVNFSEITSYDNENVRIGNEEFAISTRARKDFEKKYMEFDVNYGMNF